VNRTALTLLVLLLQITAVNAQTTNSSTTTKGKKQAKTEFADQMLDEIQVTGTRSTMKLKVDRKEFDVSSMITTAGQSATEVLENIPSVEVDNDGNVSLRGNSSVEIRINGRNSGLTSDNQAQILQQLPAESIEKIEIIDNPSAKFSAEGSAGIINIVLKKDRKAGYYGSVQVGANTRAGANTSFNINYSSSKLDAYLNAGYRHMENKGRNESEQDNLVNGVATSYERHYSENSNMGNMFFGRAGVTWHVDSKNDLGLNGMLFTGKRKSNSSTPYYYGDYTGAGEVLRRIRLREEHGSGPATMFNAEFNYRHTFTDTHMLDVVVSHNRWNADNENIYQDSIAYLDTETVTEKYMSRPLNIKSHNTEVKVDYENKLSDAVKLEAGYNGRFNRENTPQESYEAPNWDGTGLVEDHVYYNHFTYDLDIHALYATVSYNLKKLSVMAGLRGEYWRVNTESYDWDQEHGVEEKPAPFKKDYFQLFPSLFLNYQLTESAQIQLNYTRRLRRPWGGQLNSFKNTSDASMVSFGNPELTPEYTNAFSLNFLKTWDNHTLSISSYYRPTTDVIQRIRYQGTDGVMYMTQENVAKNQRAGLELIVKNKLFRILDLTTTVNGYYNKLDGFSYVIDGQTVTGESDKSFSWDARLLASLILPYDISLQLTGNYRSRQVVTQGYRKPMYGMDLGIRKTFFDKQLAISVNVRDLLDSRHFEIFTSSDTFSRHQRNWRGGRRANINITWNFGNMKKKSKTEGAEGNEQEDDQQNNNFQQDNNFQQNNNFGGGEE
jgi:outer membrane receptor protein involved in Fe transport